MAANKRWNIWLSLGDKHYEFIDCQYLNDWPDIIVISGTGQQRFDIDKIGNLNIHHLEDSDNGMGHTRPAWFDSSRLYDGGNNS